MPGLNPPSSLDTPRKRADSSRGLLPAAERKGVAIDQPTASSAKPGMLRAIGLSMMMLGYALILCGFNPGYHLRHHNTTLAVVGLCIAGLGIGIVERNGGDRKTRLLI